MELPVVDLHGQTVGRIALDGMWGGTVNTRLLSQALKMYRSNIRMGLASTKTRSKVSGGGKKPWKQKHTGRARAGSTRSPLWRHGGITFGPHPRDWHYRLPQKIRVRALLESLKGKVRDHELVIVDELAAETPKTKPFAGLAKTFAVTRKSVIVLRSPSVALQQSLRNLAKFSLRDVENVNAHDILNAHKVVTTKAAFERLSERLKRVTPSRRHPATPAAASEHSTESHATRD